MAELCEAGMRQSLKDWPLGGSLASVWENSHAHLLSTVLSTVTLHHAFVLVPRYEIGIAFPMLLMRERG